MNSTDFLNTFFGPLTKKWCNYFYAWTILFFCAFIGALASIVINLIINFKQINMKVILSWAIILLNTLLAYFVNRMLYSMCVGSLK